MGLLLLLLFKNVLLYKVIQLKYKLWSNYFYCKKYDICYTYKVDSVFMRTDFNQGHSVTTRFSINVVNTKQL